MKTNDRGAEECVVQHECSATDTFDRAARNVKAALPLVIDKPDAVYPALQRWRNERVCVGGDLVDRISLCKYPILVLRDRGKEDARKIDAAMQAKHRV